MMTIRQYAEKRGISYEAARQLVNRHDDVLEVHIHKQGRTRLLDDEAVTLLDDLRQQQRFIVQQVNPHEEIEALRAENKALLIKLDQLHDELHAEQRKNEQLHVQLQEALQKMLEASEEAIKPLATKTGSETVQDEKTIGEHSNLAADIADAEHKPLSLWQRIKRALMP